MLKTMPAILSKPSKILAMCRRQDDIVHALLVNNKPTMRRCKNYTKQTCGHFSYELLKIHQNFYENCRLVMNQERSQCLADYFFKGCFPKKRELRLLCQYYDTMYKAIDR